MFTLHMEPNVSFICTNLNVAPDLERSYLFICNAYKTKLKTEDLNIQ